MLQLKSSMHSRRGIDRTILLRTPSAGCANFRILENSSQQESTVGSVPSRSFETKDHQEICDWLCKFAAETRKGDGTEYTPRSLYLLLSALQRHDTKATPVLSASEEDVLWNNGILSLDNPVGLMNAVFFYSGKNFCLRGGAEHRNLKLSQFKKETSTIDGIYKGGGIGRAGGLYPLFF